MHRGTVVPQCDHEIGCITCGDTAVPMRVVEMDESRGLALCADGSGERETVETSLVDGVAEGVMLLVHASVALQRLETEGVSSV